MHLIYNPSKDELRDWIKAGERETWKFLPAIRSHCAVEMTLDRCVQRLRRRILEESWENNYVEKQEVNNPETFLGNRLPSFFQSPSLVNMGGLAIADQYIHYERSPLSPHKQSSTSLNTLSRSEGSGFFVDDESEFTERSLQRNVSNGSNLSQQQYLKTTNMADFYYRKSKSTEDLSATKWLGE